MDAQKDSPVTTVDQAFAVHMLNETGKAKARELAVRFTDLLTWIKQAAGTESRAVSIASLKLEEAAFFAKKAIATNTENQEH